MKKYICPNCESRNTKPYCNDCDCSIPNNSFIEEEESIIQPKIVCSSCGRTIEKESMNRSNCPHCGELLLKGTSYKTSFNPSSYNDKPNTNSYIVHYIVSILIPLAGFIMGAIFLTKKDESHVGGVCILLGIVSFIISYAILSNTNMV